MNKSKLFLNNGNAFANKLKQYEEYTKDNVLEDYCEIIWIYPVDINGVIYVDDCQVDYAV